jgi:hypothetical protein
MFTTDDVKKGDSFMIKPVKEHGPTTDSERKTPFWFPRNTATNQTLPGDDQLWRFPLKVGMTRDGVSTCCKPSAATGTKGNAKTTSVKFPQCSVEKYETRKTQVPGMSNVLYALSFWISVQLKRTRRGSKGRLIWISGRSHGVNSFAVS